MDTSALLTAITGEYADYTATALALLTVSLTLMIGIKVVKRVFMKST